MSTVYNKSLIKSVLAMTAIAFGLAGCATAKFDAEKTKQVKKLAILAVEIQQQAPKDALGVKGFAQLKTGKSAGDQPERQEMAKHIYNEAVERIKKKTGWQVVDLNTMQSNGVYKEKVQKMMEGFRTVSMAGDGYDLVVLKNNLDAHALKKLDHAEKVKLARALGADAYAVIQIYMPIEQGWSLGNLTGDAPFALSARSNLDVYDLRGEEPIWRQQNVDGESTPRSDTLGTASTPQVKLATLGKKAAESSLSKLVESYKH